jgi:hypothetical protein
MYVQVLYVHTACSEVTWRMELADGYVELVF